MRANHNPQMLASIYTLLLLAGHAAAQPSATPLPGEGTAPATMPAAAAVSASGGGGGAPIDVELIFSGAYGGG